MKTRLLLLTNIITLALLGVVLFRNKLRDKPVSPTTDFHTTAYREQTELHRHYRVAPVHAVMLGTSFTSRVQWQELLQRCDVISRGINGDVTAGILARTDEVLRMLPATCFIEGGLNDLESGVPEDSIVSRIGQIVHRLKNAGIRPVLTAVFPVGKPYPDYAARNRTIAALNGRLHQLASRDSLAMIDFNRSLAPEGALLSGYSQPDGCHLRADAYELWRSQILLLLAPRR